MAIKGDAFRRNTTLYNVSTYNDGRLIRQGVITITYSLIRRTFRLTNAVRTRTNRRDDATTRRLNGNNGNLRRTIDAVRRRDTRTHRRGSDATSNTRNNGRFVALLNVLLLFNKGVITMD